MSALAQLNAFRRAIADRHVLSVYIAAEQHDPTERSMWRTKLEQQLDGLERAVADDTRPDFVAARQLLRRELAGYRGFLPARGWVAFVTAQRIVLSAPVPAPMPDVVRWQRGPVLGPYLRALKQNRPVIIVLADSRRARLLRYHAGVLVETVAYRADQYIDDLTDRNMSKRAATRSGVRGETATDSAERILRLETEQFLRRVAAGVRAAAADALIIVGGPAPATAALQKLLEAPPGDRIVVEGSLHMLMSLAEVQTAVEAALSAATQRLHLAWVQEVVDRAGDGARGMLGPIGGASAAELGQVDTLLLTPRFLAEQEGEAERLIGLVLDRSGAIELVSGEAAALLDTHAGGVAARLRYVRRADAAVSASRP